ncbi:MAG: hypothetical protein ACM34C_09185, partial [Syntrophaceae bacterium]
MDTLIEPLSTVRSRIPVGSGMRISVLKLLLFAILTSLVILQGCAHRLMDKDRPRLGMIGIVHADYTPELGLDTFAVGGAAGATKGAFSG